MNHLPFGIVDRTLPLLPAGVPWLAHTRFWPHFTDEERLRANRLMGLLVNELALVVEHGLILAGLRRLARGPLLDGEPALHRRLVAMFADEERHARWFAAYNHAAEPEIYRQGGLHFMAPGNRLRFLGEAAAAAPGAWGLAVWLVLATEEWACGFAAMLATPDPHGAPRDEAFRRLHAAHRADELRHVDLDEELVAWLRRRIPGMFQRPLLGVARMALDQLMRPRRAAPAMLRRFVGEFPRWRRDLPELISAVRTVGDDPRYWATQGVTARLPATTRAAATWGGASLWSEVAHAE